MNDIKMKRFYGKHLDRYTGATQPECILNETGIGNRFGPLHKTGFSTTSNWRKTGSVPPGTTRSLKVEKEEKSANMESVDKYRT